MSKDNTNEQYNAWMENRMTKMEATLDKQGEQLLMIVGSLKMMEQKIDNDSKVLNVLSTKSGENSMLQKALVGAIIAQAVLSGLISPQNAGAIANSLMHLGGG